MPIDASIALGVKTPDTMQSLSSLLGTANSAQQLQNNSISLNERKAMQQVLSDPSNYTDPDGSFNLTKAQSAIMKAAPTTGAKYITDIAAAHAQSIAATQALNNLTTDNRNHIGGVLASIPQDATPEFVGKTIDALRGQYKGIGPAADAFMTGYKKALQQGPQAAQAFIQQSARGVLSQPEQRALDTPAVAQVDNGQQVQGINIAPNVAGYPQGSQVFSVQKQLPPTTPTVAPVTNQPGYLGPQPQAKAQPQAQPGAVINPADQAARDRDAVAIIQQESAAAQKRLAQLQSDPRATQDDLRRAQQDVTGTAAELARLQQTGHSGGFVPSGPVPGANEAKAGSVQVVNDHWARINAGAADTPVATSLLSTIRNLAPSAITGTEAGKKAYWTGLGNALGFGDKVTNDWQTNTDLLNKAMAQLNLATPATTDAMRTLVEAGRPHSTMSKEAIIEATSQIDGQLKANMAVRNLLTPDKRYADATGDVSSYDAKRQKLESLVDPRIFQYESLPPAQRKAFINKQADKADLIKKTQQLEAMGLFQ